MADLVIAFAVDPFINVLPFYCAGHFIGFFPVPPCTLTMPDYYKHKKPGDVWYSRPFHSSPGGYKMCLAVTAYGTGAGRGTHITVGVYLMKGEQDDYLAWPFQAAITVKLLNQKNSHEDSAEDVEGVIQFDKAGISSERVRHGDRAKHGWGNHTFVTHSEAEATTDTTQYLVNDILTFSVVDVVLLK